jgi:hypothetical protein
VPDIVAFVLESRTMLFTERFEDALGRCQGVGSLLAH